MTLWLLAHQGGWDELLLFAGPIVLMLLWVRRAERRARSHRTEGEDASSNMPSDADA